MDRRTFLGIALAAPAFGASLRELAHAQKPAPPPPVASGVPWMQWGGPNRNFQTDARGIRDTWPGGGPRVVWRRPIGEGYSSVAVEGDRLYTMYGRRGEEVVIAANAQTGVTAWEQATPMSFRSDAPEMGNGPYSTPLIVGSRVFTTGVAGRLQCLDKASGKVLWTQQLWSDHGGSRLMYGYASSPIAFRDSLIVPVGGRGKALMAFNQADGKVLWARHDFGNVYSSPILINVDGLEQVVALLDHALIAVNPHNGDLQWQAPFTADYSIAVATPLWSAGNLLFISAEYNAGAKVIELRRNGNQTTAKELWTSNRLRLHHGNAMRIGETLYFTNGGKGSEPFLTAVDIRTGTIRWQERSIGKATFVWADQKLITLDQDGTLMIAHPSPEGFKISAKAPVLSKLAWTPPSLVGTRLYARDRREMVSLDLG